MEFTLYDARSFGLSGPRYVAVETDREVEAVRFTSVAKAKAWFVENGFVFKPGIACWVEEGKR